MPRKFKLTWQPGARGRAGRWRKKYKGRAYYFSGGRGKTDREAYEAALAEWEKLKLRIDAETPKAHQADYERAIGEWELVLAWCRKHGEDEMADVAMAKLELLRKRLSVRKPRSISKKDTFEGRFDRSVRYPGLDEALAEVAEAAEKSMRSGYASGPLPGYEEYIAAANKFLEGICGPENATKARTFVVPSQLDWGTPDQLQIESEVWHDRLEVMQRSAAPPERTVQAHVDRFLEDKEASVSAGELSAGRAYTLRVHLTHFMDWLGRDTPIAQINGQTLNDYRLELLKRIETDTLARTTGKERLGSVKSFVRWLWQIEAIPSLPRIMDGKSRALKISRSSPTIVVFTESEIAVLLAEASDRTKLYILLMLNCGMTQKDVADLQVSEVDWDAGRITRKRSKTEKFASVPTVDYVLWPETLRLLRQERNTAGSGRVLLNANGRPLWCEEIGKDGKFKKSDLVRSAFDRLKLKTKISKPLKSLKKTSASLIRSNERFASLESLFLGHAPQSMSERHYAEVPQVLFNEAIIWLGGEYGIK